MTLPTQDADHRDDEPFLRVVRGNPTPEELAALVAVFLAPDGDVAAARPDQQHRSAWGDPAHVLRPRSTRHRVPGGRRRISHA